MSPVLLPAQTPVSLVPVPEAENLPVVEPPTKQELPAVPVAESGGKPKKVKKRPATRTTTQAAATPPAPAAATPPPATAPESAVEAAKEQKGATAVGALTVGGEQSPHALNDARDLIATNERRLGGLDAAKTQADLVSKVRNFQRDAEQALKSGDAEGAKTLATKGKLLLDDLDSAAGTQ